MVAQVSFFHIDLNLLRTLALLLQTRSVSATARRLGASQPTASRSLARLRELFDDPLLIRTNHGMELTRRGEDLIAPLQEWLTTTNALFAAQSFDPSSLERRFRIASTDFGVTAVLSPALARLHTLAPGIVIDVMAFSDAMFTKLTSGEIDLIVTGMDPDLSTTYSRRLFTEASACVTRAGHPLLAETGGARLSLDQFLAWPHISILVGEGGFDRINALLGDHAPRRKVIATLPYFQAAPSLLGTSDAIMTLPARAARRLARDADLAVLEAPPEIPTFDYWVLWHERSRRDPATLWIVDLLAASCASHGGVPNGVAPAPLIGAQPAGG